MVLSVRNVKKKIGGKWIIRGISFEIGEGEVFGFLGPNGSGKTTTIRMLVDLIRPTEGEIFICGKSVQKEPEQALSNVGCIVENPEMYPFMSGWENLEHFARMADGVDQKRMEEVVQLVGLQNRIHDKVKTYSLGMKQRLGIAQALLARPKLLILDEPTNGLDPQGIRELRDFVRMLAKNGISLLVSSHLLSEIQMMCDRVAIIRQGELIAVGSVHDLLHSREKRVIWKVSPLDKARGWLEQESGVRVDVSQEKALFTWMDPELVPELVKKLVDEGIRIYGVETRAPTLEEMFLRLMEGEHIG